MAELHLTSAFARGLGPLDARFSTGLSVVLGASEDDLASLCELLTGVLPARRGGVLLDGEDVGDRPGARRRIVSLLREEELLGGERVSDSLAAVCSLRGSSAATDDWLARAGLPDLAGRRPEALSPAERRAAALALALGTEDAAALVLYEPLSLAPRFSERYLLERTRERSERAVVVVLTTSLEHALSFGGALYWLERGRLQAPSQATPRASHSFTLLVWSSAAEKLAEALANDTEVGAVGFDARRATELWLQGPELERLASAVCRHARALGVTITSLRPGLPPLESVLLSRAGWTDAGYHFSRGAER